MKIDVGQIRNVLSNRKAQPVDIDRHYAVTVPLIFNEDTESWDVIYEFRSEYVSQPREISFPGGKVEPGETFREAAVRETCEELLIDKSNIEVLGELDYLVTTGVLQIRCFLVWIKNIAFEDIKPNPDEVDHIFRVPLNFLLKEEPIKSVLSMSVDDDAHFPYDLIPNGRKYNFSRGKNIVLFYRYNQYIIWGFTAKMTNSFIKIIKELELVG